VGPGSRWATWLAHQNVAASLEGVAKFREWLEYGDESKYRVAGGFSDRAKWLEMIRLLPTLRGRFLADTTPLDWPSHADVLLELANGASLPRISVSW